MQPYMLDAFWIALVVGCQGRARVTSIDSNFSVTPGPPKLACPKSEDPYSWSLSLQNPALEQEATGRQTGWPELALSALSPTGWPEH